MSDSMLQKIKALLYKAERTDVEAEALALTAKAAELMAKYSIDQAMLDATRSKAERETPTFHTESFDGVRYGNRKLVLFYVIAEALGCKGVSSGSGTLYVYGFKSDLENAKMLYLSLCVQGERFLARTPTPSYATTRAFRTSWWAGYTSRLSERVKEAMARTRQEASREPGTALVLRDRSLEVRDAFKAAHPSVRTRRVGGGSSYAGHTAGRAAADRADLGQPRTGAGSRTALV